MENIYILNARSPVTRPILFLFCLFVSCMFINSQLNLVCFYRQTTMNRNVNRGGEID